MTRGPADIFAAENGRLRALGTIAPVEAGSARHDLMPGVWLSVDPGKGALLVARPVDGHLRLTLPDAGQAAWVAMGITLSREVLAKGRFVGLRDTTDCDGFFNYRLCLRYILSGGGFVDRFAEDYAASAGGPRTCLTHIPIDHGLLDTAEATEMHLFFQGPGFGVTFLTLDLLLMG